MEDFLKLWTLYLTRGIEFIAGAVIAFAAIQAFVYTILAVSRKGGSFSDKEQIRLNLGKWLALALEFLLAADILQTAVAPTWTDIGKVGAIIALRTTLNYFLEREIEQAEKRHSLETHSRLDSPVPPGRLDERAA